MEKVQLTIKDLKDAEFNQQLIEKIALNTYEKELKQFSAEIVNKSLFINYMKRHNQKFANTSDEDILKIGEQMTEEEVTNITFKQLLEHYNHIAITEFITDKVKKGETADYYGVLSYDPNITDDPSINLTKDVQKIIDNGSFITTQAKDSDKKYEVNVLDLPIALVEESIDKKGNKILTPHTLAINMDEIKKAEQKITDLEKEK